MESIRQTAENGFEKSLNSCLKKYSRTKIIIAAFSGGPDSTVLLSLLSRFAGQFGYAVEAAYVNHGIRSAEELEQEESRVRLTSESLGAPLHVKRLDDGFLSWFAKRTGESVESAARMYRYGFFEKVSRKEGCLVALGHNANDNAETMVMRLFGGAGLAGLKGIPLNRSNFIRPLMALDRGTIESYLQETGLVACLDRSNSSNDYLRNRVRNRLLPEACEIFPEVNDSLERLSRDMGSLLDHYATLMQGVCPWIRQGGSVRCRESDFAALPAVGRRLSITPFINEISNDKKAGRIPRSFFDPLESLNPRGKIILRGRGILLIRERGFLVLRPESLANSQRYFHIDRKHPFCNEDMQLHLMEKHKLTGDETVLFHADIEDQIILKCKSGKDGTLTEYSLYNNGMYVSTVISRLGEISEIKKSFENSGFDTGQCVIIIVRG